MATPKECASGLTQEFLLRLFTYEPDTGHLIWTAPPACGPPKLGKVAGRVHRSGYRNVKIAQVEYAAHRLIWMIVTGSWPENDLDHVDRDRDNNRWGNLRAATRRQNSINRATSARNTSGVKGVWYNSNLEKWVATISPAAYAPETVKFDSRSEAVRWRRHKEAAHYGNFAADLQAI